MRLGKTHLIKELSHDAEPGAPRIKLQDNVAVYALALGALRALAAIHGLLREKPAPPPAKTKPGQILDTLPTDLLLRLRQALLDAEAKAQTIPAEAQPVL